MTSFLILTQTFINQNRLAQMFARSFFEQKELSKFWQGEEVLDTFWHQKLKENLVQTANFSDKEDFRQSMSQVYQNYSKPSLLFLGDLDQYSVALQEGMLRLLEEPPRNLNLVLFAQNISQVLPTILSRCQKIVLPKSVIMQMLEVDLLNKVKEKLPQSLETAKQMTKNKRLEIPDLSKVEREELQFWLWQVESYLHEFIKQTGELSMAKTLQKVIQAQKLNQQNVQKKLVFGWLNQ